MKLENLEVGLIVKNYKEMCNLLDEKTKTGNAKIYQIKEWECYFKYSKQGNKFYIEEIYEKPFTKASRGGSNNTKYGDLIDLLIVDLLAQSNGRISIGKSKLLQLIGMTNFNYSAGKGLMSVISEKLDTDLKTVQDFYNTNESNLSSAIESSLNRLENKSLLKYTYTYMIKSSKESHYRLATDDDLSMISFVERKVLSNLGYDTLHQVRVSSDWFTFKNKRDSILTELGDIAYYFRAYKIIANKDHLEEEKIKLISFALDNKLKKNTMHELNDKIMLSNKENATTRSQLSINDDKNLHRQSEDYIDDIEQLSKIFLSIKTNISIYTLLNDKNEKQNCEIIIPDNTAMTTEQIIEIENTLNDFFPNNS